MTTITQHPDSAKHHAALSQSGEAAATESQSGRPASHPPADTPPGPGLVVCAITARVSDGGPAQPSLAGFWQGSFGGPGRVTAAAQTFGREVLAANDDVPPWSIVIAPGVIRMTGKDLEQSYWADRRAIDDRRPHREPSKRAEITSWTRKSRAKMALTLASLDWSYLEQVTGLPAMVTLTYPADWLTVAPDGQAVKRHLRAFLLRWERCWGEPLRAAWKLEFQARGAPHIHIGPVAIPSGRAGESRLKSRYRYAIGDGLPFHQWLSVTWADVVSHPDPAERQRHERAGTAVDYREGLRCADPKRLAIYFSKHGAYRHKDYQNKVPELWREQGKGPGRFWGYWGIKPCRVMVELGKREHLLISRTLRHMTERSHVWNPATRRVETVRATRQVAVTRRRVDKLTGVVSMRRRTVTRPVRRLKYHRGFVCVNDAPMLAVDLARLARIASSQVRGLP
jgi:hypothetical protein